MPDFNKIEVFHKILHDAERAHVPVYDTLDYMKLSEDDKNLFEEIKVLWEASSHYHVPTEVKAPEAFQSFLQKIESEQPKVTPTRVISFPNIFSFPTRYLQYAAVFLLLGVATYFYITRPLVFEGGDSGLYASLEDGSKVWLQKNAILKVVKMNNNIRRVDLEGIAYFDVEDKEQPPFTIDAENFVVSVLGTRFTVESKQAVVEVYEGSVNIASEKEEKILKEKEKATLTGTDWSISQSTGLPPDWVNPILSFDNVPLDRVVRDLEAFFGVSIVLVGNGDWSRCPFTSGSLAETKFEDILTSLTLTYEMEVEKVNNQEYRFSKIRCK